MEKSCVICCTDETAGERLIPAPCGTHHVCLEDIASFFTHATEVESLFPPKCCGQIFKLQQYEDYIPSETALVYQAKEQGEYSVLARLRVYCAKSSCGTFLHPSVHVKDEKAAVTYAVCEGEGCGEMTCVSCKTVIEQGTNLWNHVCEADEEERKFKQMAKEEGFQECFSCGRMVELTEACNHITCECGGQFCYVCGKAWMGWHGCPNYGPAVYDGEGFNQEGFHRDTELNRHGLNWQQEMSRRAGRDVDTEDAEDDDEELGDGEIDIWEVLQLVHPGTRALLDQLPHVLRNQIIIDVHNGLVAEREQEEHGDEELDAEPGYEGQDELEYEDQEEDIDNAAAVAEDDDADLLAALIEDYAAMVALLGNNFIGTTLAPLDDDEEATIITQTLAERPPVLESMEYGRQAAMNQEYLRRGVYNLAAFGNWGQPAQNVTYFDDDDFSDDYEENNIVND